MRRGVCQSSSQTSTRTKHVAATRPAHATACAALNKQQAAQGSEQFKAANLAYLGDAVWSLYVRQHFFAPPKHISQLHEAANKHLNAEQQAAHHDALLRSKVLNDSEKRLLRAAAASTQGPKLRARFREAHKQDVYRKATALEALVGYLHLTNQERLQQVLAVCFGTATDASLARGMPQEAVSGSSQGQGIQGESNGA